MAKQVALDDFTAYLKAKLDAAPEEGVLRLGDTRCFLAVPSILVGVQQELEELMGTAARAPIYAAGVQAARASAKVIQGLLDRDEFSSREEAVRYLAQVWSGFGYGRIDLESMDLEKGRMTFTVANSVVAEAHGAADGPVCHWYAGFGAGLFASLFDREPHCHEMACAAAGAERCVFEMAPVEHFLHLKGKRDAEKS